MRIGLNSPLLLLALSVALFGCSDSGSNGPSVDGISVDSGPSDTGDDSSTDATEDTSKDAIQDAGNDASDVGQEDSGDDAGLPDIEDVSDAGSDITPDTSDVSDVSDVAPDIEEDTAVPPFGAQVPISEATSYESGEIHAMAVSDAGFVSIFWRGVNEDNSVDLLLSVSDPWAASFGDPIVVKSGLSMQGITAGGDMIQADSTYHFIWRDQENGSEQVYFRKTSQADLTGEDVLLAEAPDGVWRPYLARGWQGSLCAIWQHEQNVQMRCSDDDGDSWGEPIEVDPPGTFATVSSAAFNNDNHLVVALQAGGLGVNQILVRRTSDLGTNWTDATDVDGNPITDGKVSETLGETNYLKPTLIRTMTGKLKLSWHRPLVGTGAEAHMTTSTDGLSWSPPALLPNVKANVALVPGRGSALHASGTESKLGYGDTLYMSSPDEGESWGPTAAIPVTLNATLLDHRMRAHPLEGWLYIAWWETLPNNLIKQKLQLVTIEEP